MILLQVVGIGEELCEEVREETITDKDGVYRLRGLSVSYTRQYFISYHIVTIASVCVQCKC